MTVPTSPAPEHSFWGAREAAEAALRESPLRPTLHGLWRQVRAAQRQETRGPLRGRPQARADRDALVTRLIDLGSPIVAPHVAPLHGHDPARTRDEVRLILMSFLDTHEAPQERP